MTTRVVSIWCAGCHQHVTARAWNQDTYLCNSCTTAALTLIRRWASGKVLQRFPSSTILHQEAIRVAR